MKNNIVYFTLGALTMYFYVKYKTPDIVESVVGL